jgi:methionyl-tRNA synthetase
VADYVDRIATRFAALREPLDLSYDDFFRTGSDPRHRPGVERLWAACAQRGDLYRKAYSGRYCVGCEQFYSPGELTPDGRCREHGVEPELVEEENWFFRLSAYQDRLLELIASDRLRIEPESRKREVLAFIQSGLEDFSVSRSVARARGWGIPVPGDPEQVIYVWYDALANYITGPGYGTDDATFEHWWTNAERVHVIGKGIIRFHAVYWPAMLLSAGLSVPNRIVVHEYLTVNGGKISKSAGNADDPADLAARYGTDALRWWLLAEVARSGDTDFTTARLVHRANQDLANNLGNLVNRTVSMVHRYRGGVVPSPAHEDPAAAALGDIRAAAAGTIDGALADFDFRRAVDAVVAIGAEANRYIEQVRPWELAKTGQAERLDTVLAELVATGREVGEHLTPFLPAAAERIRIQCGGALLPEPRPVFARIE